MAYPLAVTEQSAVEAGGRPVRAAASLPGLAGDSGRYDAGGQVGGWLLVYEQLGAFAWWWPGGRATRNRGRRGLGRTVRGLEDISERRG